MNYTFFQNGADFVCKTVSSIFKNKDRALWIAGDQIKESGLLPQVRRIPESVISQWDEGTQQMLYLCALGSQTHDIAGLH